MKKISLPFHGRVIKIILLIFFSYAIKNRSLGQTEYGVSVEYEVWRYTKKSIYILLPSIIISFILV